MKPVANNSETCAFYSGKGYDIEESIGFLIRQAQIAMHRTIDSKVADLDLTAMQWIPLLMLAHGKARTAAELSRCSGADTSTVTRMLDRLEAKGLIQRKRSETDRRIIFLELTEEGQRMATLIPPLIADSLNQHLRGFNQQEFDTFKSMLRRIAENGGNLP